MLDTKEVASFLKSINVVNHDGEADMPLAASIVRSHLATGKTELDEGFTRQYLIDGGTVIPGPVDPAIDPLSGVVEDPEVLGTTDDNIDPDTVIDEDEPVDPDGADQRS